MHGLSGVTGEEHRQQVRPKGPAVVAGPIRPVVAAGARLLGVLSLVDEQKFVGVE